ncbi:MAG: Fpg/Nei family DNA glycosylase [Propionibacteriaceae bacterium]
MPEGHTIHALASRLNRAFQGQLTYSLSPQGRFLTTAQQLNNNVFIGAEAAGKHLFIDFDDNRSVHVHLGLIGNFAVVAGSAAANPVTGVVRWRLHSESHTADLRGPYICALVCEEEKAAVLEKLGPDPLREDADPQRAWEKIHRSRKSIAELLLDQSVLAGVGNVYRCEVLYRLGINPYLSGNELPYSKWEAIWDDLSRLLSLGSTYNQILTMDDQITQAELDLHDPQVVSENLAMSGRKLGDRYERRFFLYQRSSNPCLECGTPICTKSISGRTLYWCPTCQK